MKRNKIKMKVGILFFILILFISIKVNAVETGISYVSTKDELMTAVNDPNVKTINVVSDDIEFAPEDAMELLDLSGKTLDLNNHTIKTDNMAFIFVGTNFTVRNGTFDAKGQSYSVFIGDAVETNNVTMENVTGKGGFNIFNSSNVVFKDCDVTATNYYAIWCDQGGQAIVKSGTYRVGNATVIGMSIPGTMLKIEGGNFITNGKETKLVLESKNADGTDKWGKPEIVGGKFDAPVDEKYFANGSEFVDLGGNNYAVCNHANTKLENQKNASCTEDGYTGDVVCSTCGKQIQVGTVIQATGHNIVYNEKVKATCTKNGTEEYWSCSICNQKFEDKDGNNVITAPKEILALGHELSDWKMDKDYHWKECTREDCKAVVEETKEKHIKKDGKCEICSYEMVDEDNSENTSKPDDKIEDNKPSHKLDDEPKTGRDKNILESPIVFILIILGYAISRKKIYKK